jgi:type IV secretion system protein VirB9
MRYYFIFLCIYLGLFFSCSSVSPPYSPAKQLPVETKEEQIQTDEIKEIEVEVTEYRLPQSEESIEEDNRSPEKIIADHNVLYIVVPKKEDYKGGIVNYKFLPDRIYKIYTSPGFTTDIRLEPGEKILTAPAGGDSENFPLELSFSHEREHIYIEPAFANKKSNLFVNTNKRIYSFFLYSDKTIFMPVIQFTYPIQTYNELNKQIKDNRLDNLIVTDNILNCNYSYKIIKHSITDPPWMPSLTFDNGEKTFIYFASKNKIAYAPALFLIEGGKRIICNYRVYGNYYIVDQLFEHAELVLNENQKITIKKL